MERAEVAQLIMGLFDLRRAWDYVEMESELRSHDDINFDLIVDVCRELESDGKLHVVDDSPRGEGYYPYAFTYHGSLSKVNCS